MKKIRVEDAVGQVLCHDLTRIVKDSLKCAQFRKGHIVREEDIPMLLSMGKEHIFVWELQEGMLHEEDAAERLCALCIDDTMSRKGPVESKIELFAAIAGVFCVDTDALAKINAIDDIVISVRHAYSAVQPGDKLAAMKVIPLVIAETALEQAESIAGKKKLLAVKPFVCATASIIITGSEVAKGRIADTFTPVLTEKLARCGISVISRVVTDDGLENIAQAIADARAKHPDIILCTGGMSVDPDDNTPGAVKKSGAEIVTYGAPVLPGAMFLLGYYSDNTAVMGIPGCVMYTKATVFDVVLPRVAAGIKMTKQDFAVMGNGGLCLSCAECTYPVCPFGKS